MRLQLSRVLLIALACFNVSVSQGQTPLSTAFTYQGELAAADVPVSGTYDIRFRLYGEPLGGAQIGSTLCSDNLAVENGRFTALLDFEAAFSGQKRFLEIEVREDSGAGCADSSGFTVLMPRQELTASPNSTFALFATLASNATSLNGQSPSFYQNAANLTGTLADARLSSNIARLDGNQTFTGQMSFSNPANTFSGVFTGSGSGLTSLSGASINAGTLSRSSLSGDVQGGVGTVVSNLSLVGSIATATGPFSVAVSGSFAYVASPSSNRLQVFNISNPAAPTLVGSVTTASAPISVAVSGSFAYVVNVNGSLLQAVNISNPAAPAVTATVETGLNPLCVAVSGSFVYVANLNGNSLQVFNISNPGAPTLVGSVGTAGWPASVAVSGSFAYVVNRASNTLQVFNISNPAAPTLTGGAATGNDPFSVAVSGSFAYVVNRASSALQVFNISDPAAPTLAGTAATGTDPYSVTVSGSFAYVVNRLSNTLQVFNINSPSVPTLTGSIPTGTRPLSVAVLGSFAYVANEVSNTLQVFTAENAVRFGAPLSASNLVGVNGSGLTGVNAAQLNGQSASFYTNASNISTGTLADARLSSNVALKNAANAFTSTAVTSFAGRLGIGTATPSNQFSLEAVTNSDTQIALTSGPAIGGAIPPRTWSIQSSGVTGPQNQLTGSFQIVDRTVTASRLLIDVNGNVGIGTTSPLERLAVAGNMIVNGFIAKAGGSFKIDHPLDPENKYLYHSFVESPDMMNIYNGNVVTDDQGFAIVELPDYFEALNRDFRYQLTVVDDSENDFILTKVYREVGVEAPRQFTIKSSLPNIKISWQVTGIRKDAWAEKNRIPNTVEKTGAEKGKLLHPEAFDRPAEMGVNAGPAAGGRSKSK